MPRRVSRGPRPCRGSCRRRAAIARSLCLEQIRYESTAVILALVVFVLALGRVSGIQDCHKLVLLYEVPSAGVRSCTAGLAGRLNGVQRESRHISKQTSMSFEISVFKWAPFLRRCFPRCVYVWRENLTRSECSGVSLV